MFDQIKKYDRWLFTKKNMDWSIDIIRKSQFQVKKEYTVIEIKNQYIGSYWWVLEKLKSMDSRRIDIIWNILNKKPGRRQTKSDSRVHSDIANYIIEWNKIII
jgi:hypothetical protein